MTVRFKEGDRVRISSRDEPRHHRVPSYAKGQTGIVERVCSRRFNPPEEIAYGDSSHLETAYRVRLQQRELWPDYEGPERDHLELEIFERWLEPAND